METSQSLGPTPISPNFSWIRGVRQVQMKLRQGGQTSRVPAQLLRPPPCAFRAAPPSCCAQRAQGLWPAEEPKRSLPSPFPALTVRTLANSRIHPVSLEAVRTGQRDAHSFPERRSPGQSRREEELRRNQNLTPREGEEALTLDSIQAGQ